MIFHRSSLDSDALDRWIPRSRYSTWRTQALALVALAGLLGGCSSKVAVQKISYPWAKQPMASQSRACEARIYQLAEAVPSTCTDFADVFVGDAGNTIDCGLDRMLGEVKAQACLYGADAAQIVHMTEPNAFLSDCYEIRARLLSCKGLS